jgi:hypothetical protein
MTPLHGTPPDRRPGSWAAAQELAATAECSWDDPGIVAAQFIFRCAPTWFSRVFKSCFSFNIEALCRAPAAASAGNENSKGIA